ncbi:MAG: hypothetical protein ABII12_11270 [Planctomycetota bacterium]
MTLASRATRTQPLFGDRSADRWSCFRLAVLVAVVGMLCLLPPRVYAQTTQSEQDGIDAVRSVNEAGASVDRAAEDGGAVMSSRSDRHGPASSSATTRPVRLIDDTRVSNWWRSFVWAMVLVLVFVFGSLAIMVFSRRFRVYLTGRPREHTPCDDVWQMHKLPPAPPPEAGDDDE